MPYVICFHGNNFTLATVRILSSISRFQIMQTLGKDELVSTFCERHCTYAKDNEKVC